jgi:hypothetical protein
MKLRIYTDKSETCCGARKRIIINKKETKPINVREGTAWKVMLCYTMIFSTVS